MGLALATFFVFLGLVQENNVICLLPERNGFREEKKSMSAKQIIKSIVPKSAWKKARSIKDTMEASKARRIQRQRFMRWISLDASTDKARVETRLAFDIHRLEKA